MSWERKLFSSWSREFPKSATKLEDQFANTQIESACGATIRGRVQSSKIGEDLATRGASPILHRAWLAPPEHKPALLVPEGPYYDKDHIDNCPDRKPSKSHKHQDSGSNFPHVKPVGTEYPKPKAQEYSRQPRLG